MKSVKTCDIILDNKIGFYILFNIKQEEYFMNIKKIAAFCITAACAFGATAMADDISVFVNNELVQMDQSPVIINDRTMVPVRAVFEKAGAQVSWDDTVKTATITKDNYTVIVKLGQPYIYKNGKPISLDVPSTIVNDRIVIPVRAIAEAMDFGVTWNSMSRSVLISTDAEAYRANGQWKTGFRDTNKAGIMIDYSFDNLQLDLNGDKSADLVTFVQAGADGAAKLYINGADYSNLLPTVNGGVVSMGFVDVVGSDGYTEIIAVDGDDTRSAWFYRYNGTDLIVLKSNGSEDGSIPFAQLLFFDGIENIISDKDGIMFTNPMICTSLYSLEGTEIKRYSLDPSNVKGTKVIASYDDDMTFNIKYTDSYNKGMYLGGSVKADGIVKAGELPHNVMTIVSIEYDNVDPSRFEIYVTFDNGVNAVIWPYSA